MKILVTGGNGFLGRHLIPLLQEGNHLWVPFKNELNLLTETPSELEIPIFHSDAAIHLAGVVGGIGFNQNNQGELGLANLKMGMNFLEASLNCRNGFLNKLIIIGTTCSYPHTPKTIPFVEDELFDGMPELTNSGYGIAKRTLIKLGMDCSKQFGLPIVNLIPTNMVGEFDHFEEHKSHVVPSIIKKFEDATLLNYPDVYLWGNGEASRDFLYAGDCARAIVMALKKDIGPEPINLASGQEIKIKDLAELIRSVGDYKQNIIWQTDRPNGQPRRCLDITRARNVLGWEPTTSLEEAIRKTIDWYRQNG